MKIVTWFVGVVALLATACTGALEPSGPTHTPDVADVGDSGGSTSGGDVALDDTSPTEDASPGVDVPAQPVACGCPLGDGPYCGARAVAAAADAGCVLDPVVVDDDVLYHCESGVWSVGEQCPGTCAYDPELPDLDDHCELPDCECFVQVAWCGTGAAKKAETMGCKIPILPEHNNDILYCPDGVWSVRQTCADGCAEQADGTPDFCKTQSDYLLPTLCPMPTRCTNGNNTRTHTGKDHYAFDFGIPVGTDVLAMRGGVVHRVRNVSPPGSACHNGGGSACANYANTVEIKHTDGTIGLYMHLRRPTVAVGDVLQQGAKVGESGNSGWSTGPHLHVQVQNDCGIWWCQSIPFQFGEGRPSAGQTLVSQNCPE